MAAAAAAAATTLRRTAATAASASLVTRTALPGGIVQLALSAPPVNTLSRAMLSELRHHLEETAGDTAVRGVVLSSRCRAFSAGLDITEFRTPTEERFAGYLAAISAVFRALYLHPKPVAAAIVGAAPAGGCWLALLCDHRAMIDAPGAVIGLNETQLGG